MRCVWLSAHRADGKLEAELADVLQPHEVAAVAAVGRSGAPSFVLQVRARLAKYPARCLPACCGCCADARARAHGRPGSRA